jgi:hypothetical protein
MSPSKEEVIEERKSNLPLPEQPPRESEWNSADSRTVDVGSGRMEDGTTYDLGNTVDDPLRAPTAGSEVRIDAEEWKHPTDETNVGRQAKDHLPNDAVTIDKRKAQGTVETRNLDSTV